MFVLGLSVGLDTFLANDDIFLFWTISVLEGLAERPVFETEISYEPAVLSETCLGMLLGSLDLGFPQTC